MSWFAVIHDDMRPGEVVGWYPTWEQADAVVGDILCDAPEWRDRLRILCVDLDRWVVETLAAA